MTHREMVRLVRLAQFARTRFGRASQQAAKRWDGWLQYSPIAELFEAVWWLIQGVEAKFFPTAESMLLWREHAATIEQVLRLYDDSGFDFYSPKLMYDLRTRLASGAVYQTPEGDDETTWSHDVFGEGLTISNAFFSDRLANLCIGSLLFMPISDWERVSSKRPESDNVERILTEGARYSLDITSDTIVAGFVRILEHMGASRAYFDHSEVLLARPVRFVYPNLGLTNAWRLNFHVSQFSKRFQFAVDRLEDLARHSPAKQGLEGFQVQIKQLIDHWDKNHPFWLTVEEPVFR